ncbi:MAG: carboxypeptidase regulatory-like domain-containing protein [Bacteroidetes bacterium]|jgi:hypothetical protein|nr:carboxypeptidase regulatory-like domain-containing protein [Bacteroidota bacterium]MBT6687648.1 carboxypeptidase regulatory-like domain-containing protein [Bacteroidota bacterium]MBT7144763.1 carboxypeptidase regulatory-like domain-containing protein [Bacteroidota bacterium]MBT7491390.1 carboxypeptidase regulatory-like domain-containing protein [Bacteroidota bacterium]
MSRCFKGLIIICLSLMSCKKTEVIELDLTGIIKGEIYTLDEYIFQNNDYQGIFIKLAGSEPLITTYTNSSGKYELINIPTGTYDLIISKDGYGEYQIQGIQIVGGDEPIYFNNSLVQKSSTVVENLSLQIMSFSEINMTGIVNHNFYGQTFFYPTIRYFINNTEGVSNNNYIQTEEICFFEESGMQFTSQIAISKNLYPSGSKIYIIAYGCHLHDNGYYDIMSNQYRYSSLGIGSNKVSITIP